MADADYNQLVSDVARGFVRKLAPEELPLFRAQSQAYLADPASVLSNARPKDAMLGFGAAEILVFLTPVILQVTSQVVVVLEEEVKKSLRDESAAAIRDIIRRLFNPASSGSSSNAHVPRLATEQLQRVRKVAFEQAKHCHVPDDRANLLADAIVGQLAVAGA